MCQPRATSTTDALRPYANSVASCSNLHTPRTRAHRPQATQTTCTSGHGMGQQAEGGRQFEPVISLRIDLNRVDRSRGARLGAMARSQKGCIQVVEYPATNPKFHPSNGHKSDTINEHEFVNMLSPWLQLMMTPTRSSS